MKKSTLSTELKPEDKSIGNEELNKIIFGVAHDPHHTLGIHTISKNQRKVFLWRPGAKEVFLEWDHQIVSAKRIDDSGFFEFSVPPNAAGKNYRIFHQNGMLAQDPYAFLPSISQEDLSLFSRGIHYELYRILGAHIMEHEGVMGTRFAVWAPNATRVSLVADFNYWDGRTNPMRSLGYSGVWEIFIPGITVGQKYKFEIKTKNGEILVKSDPFAFSSELRPFTASIVTDTNLYQWKDQKWMSERRSKNLDRPFVVYEVHLGAWKRPYGKFMNYRQLSHELAEYCKEMGFTHIELMPVAEHPFDDSWGYQTTGYFSPTSRFGSFQDFQYFIDILHQNGIGVLLDWVPAHFPQDAFSLGRFDGTALYEHEHEYQGIHPHWSTFIYNYTRAEVTNFLIASAIFWLEKLHIDGLRVDAVASMLYLDYGRNSGEWIPNKYGGNINIDALEFLKHLNSIVHQKIPGALMIAEESTAFPFMTKPVDQDGVGFDMKWNMGWMNDTLRYFCVDPFFRHYHHNDLTFGLLYAFSERFMLPFSHDEVVHCKRSLLSKMPGDLWQQYANMRLLYSYMICQPGKKLLFMGGEIGQREEWNCHQEIEWFGLQHKSNFQMQTFVKELNQFYHNHPAFWENDFHYTGFEWVQIDDSQNSVIGYLRKGKQERILCVHNFTPVYHEKYYLRFPNVKEIVEIFNSDHVKYGGSGKHAQKINIFTDGIEMSISPLATMIFSFK